MTLITRRAIHRREALGLVAACCAPVHAGAQPSQANTAAIRVGKVQLHVALAAGSDVGILIQPTIRGLTGHVRAAASELAANGLTGVVWDPFADEPPTNDPVAQIKRTQHQTDDQIVADLRAAVDYMVGTLRLKAVGSMGWCFGGRTALVHAGHDPRILAVSAYNPTILTDKVVEFWGMKLTRSQSPGQTMDEFALAAKINGPVQIVRPGHDIAQPDDYARLLDVLQARPQPTLMQFYPSAAHGFSYTPDTPANVAAGRQSWASSLSFFKTALLT